MNVSHDPDLRTEEAVVRVLRAARANDAAALPTRHAHRTDACVPVSRLAAAARLGTVLTAADRAHLSGCAFCRGVIQTLRGAVSPVDDEETTVLSTAEETTHFNDPRPKPPGGA